MNVIFIVVDSLRPDHVGAYHRGQGPFPDVPACRTPNLDRFARDCVVFDQAFPEGLPTLPARVQLLTGQATLASRGWEPLRDNDVSLAQLLARRGYTCGLVSDTYHLAAPGMNLHRGFQAVHWIRGQEYDPWALAPPRRDLKNFVNRHYPPVWKQRLARCLANQERAGRAENERFPAQVAAAAGDFLRANRRRPVFLWLDCFDPHEPWDPPPRFDVYGDRSYRGRRLVLPLGGRMADWAKPAEVRHLRAMYAGETAFVDHCLGKVFACLEKEGYLENSLVALISDHGSPLGDHGKFLKGSDRLYSELLRLVWFVRPPGRRPKGGGRRTPALVQTPDLPATVWDYLGLKRPRGAAGRSFRRVLEGKTDRHRAQILTGYREAPDRCLRDGRWSLILRPPGEPDELYDLANDPREERNLFREKPAVVRRLKARAGRIPRGRSSGNPVSLMDAYGIP